MRDLADNLLNTPSGVAITGTVSYFNLQGVDLPLLINIGTAIYLVMLIIHKGWKMYKEWKTGHASSE